MTGDARRGDGAVAGGGPSWWVDATGSGTTTVTVGGAVGDGRPVVVVRGGEDGPQTAGATDTLALVADPHAPDDPTPHDAPACTPVAGVGADAQTAAEDGERRLGDARIAEEFRVPPDAFEAACRATGIRTRPVVVGVQGAPAAFAWVGAGVPLALVTRSDPVTGEVASQYTFHADTGVGVLHEPVGVAGPGHDETSPHTVCRAFGQAGEVPPDDAPRGYGVFGGDVRRVAAREDTADRPTRAEYDAHGRWDADVFMRTAGVESWADCLDGVLGPGADTAPACEWEGWPLCP